jgi:hypothetical protein
MFVRFRKTRSRLQASLCRTQRVKRAVKHEHIAQLGSIAISPSVADRLAFWTRIHERLAANRIAPEMLTELLAAIHERVPMVTPSERDAEQIKQPPRESARH